MCYILKQVQQILSRQFCVSEESIQPEAEFVRDLGSDSYHILEIMAAFELTFDIEIDYDSVPDILTVQDAIFYIQRKIDDNNNLQKYLM
jgi:acyl carrier protein